MIYRKDLNLDFSDCVIKDPISGHVLIGTNAERCDLILCWSGNNFIKNIRRLRYLKTRIVLENF